MMTTDAETLTDRRDYQALLLSNTPLLDVRAPVEFEKGAFPGAINLPLLTDSERHKIGICYARQGQQAAIELGQQLVSGDRLAKRMQGWLQWCQQHPDGVIYCFRGGLRSRTVQQWLQQAGQTRPLVQGGYKAMRGFLLQSFERDIQRQPLLLLCGPTGSGKTRVISALNNSIDLEGLAHHRGSAFGRRPGGQPAQIDFENRLTITLLQQRSQQHSPLVLEDESRLIGRCYLPATLQACMAKAPRIAIEEDLASRVRITLEDYVLAPLQEFQALFDPQQAFEKLSHNLLDGLERIRKKLGANRHQELRESMQHALNAHDQQGHVDGHGAWIEPLLKDYYDPMYDYMLSKRQGENQFTGSRADVLAYLKNL